MSRKRRSYLPGTSFHLTARTIGHEPWFDEQMRDRICAIIARAQERTDVKLLAHVVMTNHFHLVVQQGRSSLGQFMQPICRETALAVQRMTGREGYVFERRYREKACADPDYLRDAIVYVHRNPLAASLCPDPLAYRWSSHANYCNAEGQAASAPQWPRVTAIPELFESASPDPSHRGAGYRRYFAWRDICAQLPEDAPRPARPDVTFGDSYWSKHFVSLPGASLLRPDLRDIVLRTLQDVAPKLEFQTLRLRRGGTEFVIVRREIIKRCVLAGHRNVDIARYMKVSESTVSKIATSIPMRPPVRFR